MMKTQNAASSLALLFVTFGVKRYRKKKESEKIA
jgi:hypothetical protein